MNVRTILILSFVALMGAPNASAQSFKDKFKKAAEKVGQQVKQEVSKKTSEQTSKASGKTSKSSQTSTKTTRKSSTTQQTGGNTTSAALPATHTALFAPLGTPVDAKYGTKTVKAVKPPKEDVKQPDWNDSRTLVYELDNQSLVEEYLMMEECLDTKYISPSSPAVFRHSVLVDELAARAKALDRMVEIYNEAKDYETDGDEGFADMERKRLAEILKSRPYQTVIRSSIAPLFNVKGKNVIGSSTKAYFKANGGYENAHKAKWTVWNP